MKALLTCLGIVIFCAALLWGLFAVSWQEESRGASPDGKYVATWSVPSWARFIPSSPGSSGDRPCRVEIFDNAGRSRGRVPVEMLQLAGLEWRPGGAEIESVAEWDFTAGTCYYWSADGNRKIYVKR
jgi:hypothetical protein